MKKLDTKRVNVSDAALLLEVSKDISGLCKVLKGMSRYNNEDDKSKKKIWPDHYHKIIKDCMGMLGDVRSNVSMLASLLLNDEVERIAEEDAE